MEWNGVEKRRTGNGVEGDSVKAAASLSSGYDSLVHWLMVTTSQWLSGVRVFRIVRFLKFRKSKMIPKRQRRFYLDAVCKCCRVLKFIGCSCVLGYDYYYLSAESGWYL